MKFIDFTILTYFSCILNEFLVTIFTMKKISQKSLNSLLKIKKCVERQFSWQTLTACDMNAKHINEA